MNSAEANNSDNAVENNRDSQQIDPKKLLSFGSQQIISLFVPVSICMLLVGFIAKTITFYSETDQYLIYTPFHTKDANVPTIIWQSLVNSLIIICLVVVMSVVLVLLYKYRCYKCIHGYLIVSTVMILFLLFTIFFARAVIAMNIFMDYLTFALIIWNFGIVGLIVIHWKGPLIIQQSYLIVISANIALILLKYLPQWTTWCVLAVLAIWDLVAVLCPFGPLRILVEIASERNEPIFPALIYSTTATIMVKEGDGEDNANVVTAVPNNETDINSTPEESDNVQGQTEDVESGLIQETTESRDPLIQEHKVTKKHSKRQQTKNPSTRRDNPALHGQSGSVNNDHDPQLQINDGGSRLRRNIQDMHDDVMDRGDRGVKLGLGDFVFYSLLMGRATLDSDHNTILACYVSILIGMFLTVLLLTMAGRALPALPISMACGILFYFVTSLIISPFTEKLLFNRVFI